MSISVPDPTRRRRARRGLGDQLREEILGATIELLLETGQAKAVSIRSVAQRVRVTSPSIYLHFADKDALLDAVCARYFENLDAEMQRAAVGQSTALDVLRAQRQTYVRFALANPEQYRIATMGEGTPGGDVDSTLTISAFQHMVVAVQHLMDEGVYAPGDPTTIALEPWTVAHGIAALLIAKPYLPWGDVEEFTDRVMRAVCAGQIVTGILGQDACPKDVIDWLFSRGGQPQDE